jgi:hypothetical protein
MNSAIQEILSFKTCCGLMTVFDQNLEIHLKNTGGEPVFIVSLVELEGDYGTMTVQTATLQGVLRIEPGDIKALYCYLDEELWYKTRRITFHDGTGNGYRFDVSHKDG